MATSLLIVSIAHAVNPWLYKLQFRSAKSFAPIAPYPVQRERARGQHRPAGQESLKEFIALAKQQPGKIQYASGGVGGSLHLAMELFKVTAGIDLAARPVQRRRPRHHRRDRRPHQGDQRHDLDAVAAYPRRQAARARVTGKKRSEALPDVPTFEEGRRVRATRPATGSASRRRRERPQPIIARLHKEIAEMQRSAGVPEADRASTAPRLLRMARLSSANIWTMKWRNGAGW